MHSHVQLKPDSVGIHFIAKFALSVFQQTGAPLYMIFQVSQNKERLVAGSTEEPLLYVPSLVGFQTWQVGALDSTLVASKVCFHAYLVHPQFVLVQEGALSKLGSAEVT